MKKSQEILGKLCFHYYQYEHPKSGNNQQNWTGKNYFLWTFQTREYSFKSFLYNQYFPKKQIFSHLLCNLFLQCFK